MMKIPARIKRVIATVPEITFVKYNRAIMIAADILADLSMVPMFGFI